MRPGSCHGDRKDKARAEIGKERGYLGRERERERGRERWREGEREREGRRKGRREGGRMRGREERKTKMSKLYKEELLGEA